jgi:hypothetical protein
MLGRATTSWPIERVGRVPGFVRAADDYRQERRERNLIQATMMMATSSEIPATDEV